MTQTAKALRLVKGTQDICDYLGVPYFETLKKAIYKGTDCGMPNLF